MNWEIVIGLEAHVQLATKSKIFSSSSTHYGALPNTQANEVDMALPGSLPVLNRQAVEHAIRFGLAIGAQVSPRSIFARKNYFYPDLPKNYQISQYEIPVVLGGKLACFVDGHAKTFHLTRAHLEEDAGKSLHENFSSADGRPCSGIDLNRAGTPLLEIVSEPEMRSAADAVAYAKALHALVVWLGICDGNMQEGSFRIDANVSVRPVGQPTFGTRTETKNVNSFRFLERAIQYEARRQIEVLQDGGKIVQETRLYDADRDETRSMRSKEDAHDYRYFPDPDLPPLIITSAWMDEVRSTMPELPAQMRDRFVRELDLPEADAAQICQDRATAQYFEAVNRELPPGQAKLASNWLMGELAASLNRDDKAMAQCPIEPKALARLLNRIVDGTLSNKIARDVFTQMWSTGSQDPDQIIEASGLKQISDAGAIGSMVDEVIAANPAIVQEYRAGKQKAFNSLVGQIMKLARGKANPAQVNELLKTRLDKG
jgi:aspartyl-tRNA(Asn)/glutamyl-tRNA(Gln) amidotransferase subunit B